MSLVWNYAREEFVRLFRKPTRLLLFFTPLLTTTVCLFAYAERVARHMPVVVVDHDRSGLSRILTRDMAATPQMAVSELPDEESARRALRRGEVRAVAIFPDGMDREVRQGRTARMVFWRDATNMSATNQLYSAMATIVATESSRLCAGRLMMAGLSMSQAKEMVLPLRSDPRGLTNPNFDYLASFSIGFYPMFLMMGLLLAGASLFASGWETSETPYREFLGRALPWFVGQTLITLGYYLWFVPSLGAAHAPTLPTTALCLLLITAALAFGTLVGRFSLTLLFAAQLMLAFSTPAFLLSGYTFPEWAFPEILNRCTRPFPFSLFMDSYRGFAGWASDKAWSAMGLLALWLIIPLALLAIPNFKGFKRIKTLPPSEPAATLHGAFASEFHRICTMLELALLFFVAPVEYFALYGSVFLVKEERKLPIAVMNAQRSQVVREIVRGLMTSPFLEPLPMASELEARQALKDGKVRALLEFPTDLDLRLARREATQVPLIFPTDRFLPANDIQRAVSAVLMERGARERAQIIVTHGVPFEDAAERATPLELDDRPLASPHETYGDFMIPFLGLIILHQITLTLTALATAAGTCHPRNAFARAFIFTAWMGMWAVVWFTGTVHVFQVPTDIQVLPLAGLVLLGLLSVSAMGIAMGSLLGSPLIALQVLPFTSYPFIFLSGMSWPREIIPKVLRILSYMTPSTPLLTGANRAVRLGAGFIDLKPEFQNLAITFAGWSIAAYLLIRWRSKRNRSCAESRSS